MNKKSVLFKSIALTSVFVLNMGLYMSLNRVATELDAYSTTTLPTTIDLNDCSEQEIRSYYSGLNSLNTSERQGTNLLKNLKNILKNEQKYLAYDNSNAIWQMYEITDRDWDKSPVDSLTYGTYSSITNKITGYKYGNNSDGKNNPYIHALYVNRNVNNQTTAWDDHSQTNWGINREHVWPKSHGFDTKGSDGAGGARGDPMHLWAGNGYANNIHSNYFYAFVDRDRAKEDCGDEYSYLSGNLRGYSKNAGGNQKVFEPQDCDKGDIARAVFYMVARYNNYAGNDSSIDGNNPNLIMLNDLSENTRTGTSASNESYGLGLLSDLLAWNKLDPVDEYEIHRNNLLYRNYTNNRNPFIDFPSWADAIWGTADLDGTNYDFTITSYATPSSDPINASGSGDTFGISVSSLDLQVNETAEIYARNANDTITWTVDDDTVVDLNKNTTSGNETVTVTALKGGTATITATCGGDSVNCSVTVTNINYGSLEHPLSVDEAIETISLTGPNETAQPLYVKGIATSASYSDKYKNFNYVWLQSDDGQTAQAFKLYHTKLDDQYAEEYSNNNSIVDKEVIAYGYGTLYNSSTYELCESTKNPTYPIILSIGAQPEPVVHDYLDNSSPYLDLLATENDTRNTETDEIIFVNLGLANGSVLTSFDLSNGLISFDRASGGNDPAYYTNGHNARVYKGNTFTLSSSSTITRIEFSFTNGYSDSISVDVGTLSGSVWTGSASSVTFTNSTSSNEQIRFTEVSMTTSEGELTISDIALRFGITIPKSDWNNIHSKWTITDYGVMICTKTTLNNTYGVSTIEEAHTNGDYLMDLHKKTYAEPYALDEDNYLFTVKLKMGLNSSCAVTYCAASYIIAGGQYYFVDQIETSVNDLASDFYENGGSSLSDDALDLLSKLH